jgi:hypothetical protein
MQASEAGTDATETTPALNGFSSRKCGLVRSSPYLRFLHIQTRVEQAAHLSLRRCRRRPGRDVRRALPRPCQILPLPVLIPKQLGFVDLIKPHLSRPPLPVPPRACAALQHGVLLQRLDEEIEPQELAVLTQVAHALARRLLRVAACDHHRGSPQRPEKRSNQLAKINNPEIARSRKPLLSPTWTRVSGAEPSGRRRTQREVVEFLLAVAQRAVLVSNVLATRTVVVEPFHRPHQARAFAPPTHAPVLRLCQLVQRAQVRRHSVAVREALP